MINITLTERLILTNQYKILEKLCPEDAKYYRINRIALEYGFQSQYDELFLHIHKGKDEMTEEECKEVLDVLSMFRGLKDSYKALKDKSGIKERVVQFPGFDGTNEAKQLLYTQYLINELGKFQEFKNDALGSGFDSHCPMLDVYRKMLQVWKQYKGNGKLTRNQIEEIIGV